ncbi:hypothetical protein DFH09DRAFT_1068438 [Mycena vulgaris]|nr:hypothetical protein DFH09DRAFT_1068438 [Mycena vulgaris]
MLLPAELSDKIIDQLSTDPATLARTALVCRQWVPTSRRHKFSTVKVSGATCTRLLSVLQDKNNTFRWHIKRLEFSVASSWAIFDDFVRTLPELPSVEGLALSHFSWPEDASPREVIAKFPALVEIAVIQVSIDTHLMRTLAEFPRLRSVCIGNAPVGVPDKMSIPQQSFPCLQDLRWSTDSSGPSPEACRWLAAQTPPPPLETLDLHRISFPLNESAARAVLRAFAPSLRNLTFLLVSRDFPSMQQNPAEHLEHTLLDFSAHTQLRSLAIGTSYIDIGGPFVARLPAILANIASPELRSLRIAVPPLRGEALGDSFLGVDQVLSGARFARLEDLALVFWDCLPVERAALEAAAGAWFPGYRLRGEIPGRG